MYHAVDEFSREALFTLANDYRLGLPLAIVGMSLIIKGIFLYACTHSATPTSKAKQWR